MRSPDLGVRLSHVRFLMPRRTVHTRFHAHDEKSGESFVDPVSVDADRFDGAFVLGLLLAIARRSGFVLAG